MSGDLVGSEALEARLRAVGGTVPREVGRRWQIRTVRIAKLKVRRRTGNLGRSIAPGLLDEQEATVVATAAYAKAVEYGSRPHIIVPRYRRALRFAASAAGARLTGSPRVGAAVVFARLVRHPGTRPYPFLAPAASQALREEQLEDVVYDAWNGAA